MSVSAVAWLGDVHGRLQLIDQTLLPGELRHLDCTTVEDVWQAIRRLAVRGAPAIGVAAAYGVILGCRSASSSRADFDAALHRTLTYLAESRPTAVNLFWALDRMRRVAEQNRSWSPVDMTTRLLEEARAIETEDRAMCAAIGRHGAALLPKEGGVLTHCNTGSLATAGDGTALACIVAAVSEGRPLTVYADETRPLLQGARLTAWELMQRKIPVTLICDSMAAWVMKQRRVHAVIVGADRIAANGDSANKIGTYGLSVLAKEHGIPFYVAAPSSTFDLSIATGDEIPIEERPAREITAPGGVRFAPEGCQVYNPAFDVAPARCITAIITERGVISPVTRENVAAVVGSSSR